MKLYILSVVCVSLFASVIILLSPDGKNNGISKHVRLLTSLCILAAITDPLVSFVKGLTLPSPDNLGNVLTDGIYEEKIEETFLESMAEFSASQFEIELERIICEKFELKDSDISVISSYKADSDGIKFLSVKIKASGLAIFKDPREIETFVTHLTELSCKYVI